MVKRKNASSVTLLSNENRVLWALDKSNAYYGP